MRLLPPVEGIQYAVTIAELGIGTSMIGCLLLGIAIFGQRRQPVWVKLMFDLSLCPALADIEMLLMALNKSFF